MNPITKMRIGGTGLPACFSEGLEKAFDYRGLRATPYNRPPGLLLPILNKQL